MDKQPIRIGSELRTTASVETIRNPYDGSTVGQVCLADERDIEDAISTAARAFKPMQSLPVHRRAQLCEATADAIERRAEVLTRLIVLESGKPIRYAKAEVQRAVVTFRLGSLEARRLGGEVLPIDLQASAEGRICLFTRVARGPVAAISPFNFPLNLIAHKLAPAAAIGAPCVLKPPPQCPLTGLLLGELMAEVGLPDGALSIVHCPPELAQKLVEDDRLKVLSFTGSDTVGWKLKALAGRKQVLLELGGNAPCVIDEGVDLDQVLDAVLNGAWAYAGQVCIKVQRVLVHSTLFDRFLERFVERTKDLAVGDPMDPKTVVGPLIQARHVERVLNWIAEATAKGAHLHCGGTAQGQVVLPTVLTDVNSDMRIVKDEVFGPVTVVERFDSFDQALAMCNASRFGLQAGVFTNDLGHALQAYRELEYGGVLINDVPTFRVDNFPYGGTKDSGFGREGVRYAIEEMTEHKVLVMRGQVDRT